MIIYFTSYYDEKMYLTFSNLYIKYSEGFEGRFIEHLNYLDVFAPSPRFPATILSCVGTSKRSRASSASATMTSE